MSSSDEKRIDQRGKSQTDADVSELVDFLLAHPDSVTNVLLDYNQLTDETGVKLARFVAASTTIDWLSLSSNLFGEATFSAMAAALRVNTSLRGLFLHDNQAVTRRRIDAAFSEALRANGERPAESMWWLVAHGQNDLPRLSVQR